MSNQQLDLRPIAHGMRHGLVFAAFDALKVDECFEIVNDHDPFPLRMQMDFMRPGQLGWEYIERAPEAFRVRITRVKAAAGNRPKQSGTDGSVFTQF